MGWIQPAQFPPKLPLSRVSHWLALSLQRRQAKRKQALAVSMLGGTGIFCSEIYFPDCPPWKPIGRNSVSCTACDPRFVLKVQGNRLDMDSEGSRGLPQRSGSWRAPQSHQDWGGHGIERARKFSSADNLYGKQQFPREARGCGLKIAGKHSPKAIYSSYFQNNTQTFMLAVLAASLKSALLKLVLVCIEIGEGRIVLFLFVGTLRVSSAPAAFTIITLSPKILTH